MIKSYFFKKFWQVRITGRSQEHFQGTRYPLYDNTFWKSIVQLYNLPGATHAQKLFAQRKGKGWGETRERLREFWRSCRVSWLRLETFNQLQRTSLRWKRESCKENQWCSWRCYGQIIPKLFLRGSWHRCTLVNLESKAELHRTVSSSRILISWCTQVAVLHHCTSQNRWRDFTVYLH